MFPIVFVTMHAFIAGGLNIHITSALFGSEMSDGTSSKRKRVHLFTHIETF